MIGRVTSIEVCYETVVPQTHCVSAIRFFCEGTMTRFHESYVNPGAPFDEIQRCRCNADYRLEMQPKTTRVIKPIRISVLVTLEIDKQS